MASTSRDCTWRRFSGAGRASSRATRASTRSRYSGSDLPFRPSDWNHVQACAFSTIARSTSSKRRDRYAASSRVKPAEAVSRLAWRCAISSYACWTVIGPEAASVRPGMSSAAIAAMVAKNRAVIISTGGGMYGSVFRFADFFFTGVLLGGVVLLFVEAAVDRLPVRSLLRQVAEQVVRIGQLQHQRDMGRAAGGSLRPQAEGVLRLPCEKRRVPLPLDPVGGGEGHLAQVIRHPLRVPRGLAVVLAQQEDVEVLLGKERLVEAGAPVVGKLHLDHPHEPRIDPPGHGHEGALASRIVRHPIGGGMERLLGGREVTARQADHGQENGPSRVVAPGG